jgi:uncharacterized protein
MTTMDRRPARSSAAELPPPPPSFGVGFWRAALGAPALVGIGPYGPLGPPDIYGLRLPGGFRGRLLGRTGRAVAGTDHIWPDEPSGGGTLRTRDGGWVYVSSSERPAGDGAVSAIRFSPEGRLADAYSLLAGTTDNRGGAMTPWDSWLSCERHERGRVWECDPTRPGQGSVRAGLGVFAHSAVAVDPRSGWLYLTEDDRDGRLYRFRPDEYGDLSTGVLEAAKVRRSGHVDWVEVSSKRPERSEATTGFQRASVAWFAEGHVFVSTAIDRRVWALDVGTNECEVVYDADAMGLDTPLHDPDDIVVHERSGDIFVSESADGDAHLLLLADANQRRVAAPFVELVGHDGSEICGVAFSPDGSRLYFSSQRGLEGEGLTFEVTGPFRRQR